MAADKITQINNVAAGEHVPASNVNHIPGNKHIGRNYQSGRLVVKCLINNYCPMLYSSQADDSLIFNSKTAVSFKEDVFRYLSYVPGLEGFFLKPKYVRRSNFLVVPNYVKNEEVDPYFVTEEYVLDIDNPYTLFTTGNGEDNTNTPYKPEYSWIIERSFYDTSVSVILGPWDYPYEHGCIEKEEVPADARWSYFSKNRGADEDSENISYQDIIDAENADPEETMLEEAYESVYGDSCIWFIGNNAAAKPVKKDNVMVKKSIHWKVDKLWPVFEGADFFIEFVKQSYSQDVSRQDPVPFSFYPNEAYRAIDVRSMHNTENWEFLPVNQGVVSYTPIKDEETGKIKGYKSDEDSKKFLDFNNQSYLVVEIGMGDEKHNYFLIITEKQHPTLIRVVREKYRYVSHELGLYKAVSGEELLKKDSFIITVRNHLGKLVITFSGYEDQPFIVSQRPLNDEDTNLIKVPEGQLSVFGGNSQYSFNFGYLEYNDSYVLNMPPGGKTSKDESVSDINNFEVLKFGSAGTMVLLSSSDTELLKASEASAGTEGLPDILGAWIDKRLPVYTCDAQHIEEAALWVGDDNFVIGKIDQFISFFAQTGNFLKAHQNYKIGEDIEELLQTNAEFLEDAQDELAGAQAGYADAKTEKEKEEWQKLIIKAINDITVLENQKTNLLGLLNQKIYSSIDPEGSSCLNLSIKVDEEESNDDVISMKVDVQFLAGSHNFATWMCNSCKTPILTTLRLLTLPDKVDAWAPNPIDVSDYVLSFSDNWSAQDFHSIDHTGSIKFLITDSTIGNETAERLLNFRNKAFYIEVWAGYGEYRNFNSITTNNACNYTRIPDLYKMFTGICYGGTVEQKAGIMTMECNIADYMKILENQYFFNSPWFDGVRDLNAVYKIISMAGFKDNQMYDPGYLSRISSEHRESDYIRAAIPDGRLFKAIPYALPASYQRLEQSYLKYEDGKSYLEGIKDIAQKSGKIIFFDALGMFHYESLSFDTYIYGNADERDIEALTLWYYTKFPNKFGQLCFDTLIVESAVEDVINNIHLMTTTPNHEMVILDDVNFDSIHNPNSEGFLGYRKTYAQIDGIFGNKRSLLGLASHYSKLYRPPVVCRFESYGLPIRALDIAMIEEQPLILTEVSSTLDPQENKWWQTLVGEWYQPSILGFTSTTS